MRGDECRQQHESKTFQAADEPLTPLLAAGIVVREIAPDFSRFVVLMRMRRNHRSDVTPRFGGFFCIIFIVNDI